MNEVLFIFLKKGVIDFELGNHKNVIILLYKDFCFVFKQLKLLLRKNLFRRFIYEEVFSV